MMKVGVTSTVAALGLLIFSAIAPAWAGTPEEAKALADQAAVLVAAEGEKAFPKISDLNGEFVQGDLFVAVLDHDGVVRAINNPKLIGVSMNDAVDPDGVRFAYELVKIAETKGSGWLTYKYTNPASKRIEPKKTWVVKAGAFAVLCGAYVAP